MNLNSNKNYENSRTEGSSFSSWFGNSVIVDSEDNPRVVYHGTSSSFTQFRNPYTSNDLNMFSETAHYAEQFALGDGANIIPVFLSIQNPLDLSSLPSTRGDVRPKLLKLLDRAGVDISKMKDMIPYERDLFQIINIAGHHTIFPKVLSAAGFDGIKMPDIHGVLEA